MTRQQRRRRMQIVYLAGRNARPTNLLAISLSRHARMVEDLQRRNARLE